MKRGWGKPRDSRKKINEAVITETRGDAKHTGSKTNSKGTATHTHTFQESLYTSIALSIQLKDTGYLNRIEKQNVSFGSCLQETALKTGSALKRRDGKPHPNQKGLESRHSVPHSRLTKQTSNWDSSEEIKDASFLIKGTINGEAQSSNSGASRSKRLTLPK